MSKKNAYKILPPFIRSKDVDAKVLLIMIEEYLGLNVNFCQ